MSLYTLMVMVAGQVQHPILQYDAIESVNAQAERTIMAKQEGYNPDDPFKVSDDYGRTLFFDPLKIEMVLVQDVDQALEGDNHTKLKQAQAEARLHRKAGADPTIQAAAKSNQIRGGLVS